MNLLIDKCVSHNNWHEGLKLLKNKSSKKEITDKDVDDVINNVDYEFKYFEDFKFETEIYSQIVPEQLSSHLYFLCPKGLPLLIMPKVILINEYLYLPILFII